jgi:hypothetical protein
MEYFTSLRSPQSESLPFRVCGVLSGDTGGVLLAHEYLLGFLQNGILKRLIFACGVTASVDVAKPVSVT